MKRQKQPHNKIHNETLLPAINSIKNIYLLLFISGIILLLYFPILNYKFTNHDDTTLIEDNYNYLKNPSNVFNLFTKGVYYSTKQLQRDNRYYRPILTLSFLIDTQTGGKSYWQFFLTNILLHIACCILLFFLLQKLKYEKFKSLFVTLIYAVHPALVQAVAWVPGRNDSLLTLFALISTIFYIDYFEKNKIKYAILHFIFFIISLLTKESIVFLPVLLYLYFILLINNGKNIISKSLKLKYFIVGWIVISILFFLIRKSILTEAIGLPLSFTINNLFLNLPGIIQYIGKMLLPFHLNTSPIVIDTPIIYGIITIVLLSFLLIKAKQKNIKMIIWASVWLIIFLIPAILRTSDKYEAIQLEHRMYFPIIGFLIIILETDLLKKINFKNKIHLLIVVLILLFYFALSINHSADYSDEFHYCKSGIEGSPHNSLEHNSYGIYYQVKGDKQNAIKEYNKAILLNPVLPNVKNNLGKIYFDNSNDSLAEFFFQEELKINQNSDLAYSNLGSIRFKYGNYSEAEELKRKALSINPDNVIAKNDLAACLAMQKKYEDAIKICVDILDKYPTYQYPINYIKQIFSIWDNKEKVAYYKKLLTEKAIKY